jgi:hypothetical protein
VPLPESVPLYQRNAPVPPVTSRVCVKAVAVGGDEKSSCSWRMPMSVSPFANVIVNVPTFAPVARLGKLMSCHVMLPSGTTEPVPLPINGGFAGSPDPTALIEYVALIVVA